jgi:outer membrane receptor protein involved in Fe transport
VNYRFQSGFPYSPIVPDGSVVTNAATATQNSDGRNTLNVCNFGCAFFAQNIDQNRSDAVNLMNIRLDKSIPIGSHGAKGMIMLDIYNVLNADPVTNFNLALGPSYKNVIAVLDPRVFQLGFRLEF